MEPVPTDFWGVVVPSWLGALASIAASTVAVIAFINSLSAKGGVREIGDALNREPTAHGAGERGLRGVAAAPEPWSVEIGRGVGAFRNTSGQLLTVTRMAATAGIEATLREQMPLEVPPDASFEVRLRRVLGGPAVRGVTLEWVPEDGERVTRTYYL
ncbi:hypothetical protein [Microbacterium sp. 3J1]|uniref:hypothetical protein n=1 Tax=Microbacterium sp. 3J1 TaxID=861269 RepID=UPI000B243831|nr:hypothetical protein [Microbacterium sp. 3J1]